MNSFELDQPLDLRLKALNLSRGFSHEPPQKPLLPPTPTISPHQYGPHLNQHHGLHQSSPPQNLLMVNNMMLSSSCHGGPISPGSTCTGKLLLAAPVPSPTLVPNAFSHYQHHATPPTMPQQQQQQQQQTQLTPPVQNAHRQPHQQTNPTSQQRSTTPIRGSTTPISSPSGNTNINNNDNICNNPAPSFTSQASRSLNHPLASPISSFKPSSPPMQQQHQAQPLQLRQQSIPKPQNQHNNNTQTDSSPSTPASSASPMIRQHSLVSRYNCKPCGIVFSQPETLRAHQEGYCTKTNRNQLRSQSAGFALRHPADCEF